MLVFFIVFALSGCAPSFKNTGSPLSTYQKPEQLYLLPEPCPRLYVEVDVVEGAEPPPEALAALKETLEEFCDKPGGIEIVQGDPIPLSDVRGKSSRLIALQHLDGPPKQVDSGQTAYLYILFFNSSQQNSKEEKPHAGRYYPCAVYIDLGFERGWPFKHLSREIMIHELGHILGLSKNTNHGDGAHCRNENCVMFPQILVGMRTWLFGIPPEKRQDKFCDDCLSDIEVTKKNQSDGKLHFLGPLLVRREEGYTVATAPYITGLSFEPDEQVFLELFTRAKKLSKAHTNLLENQPGARLHLQKLPTRLTEKLKTMEMATEDPDPNAAEMAKNSLKKLSQDKSSTRDKQGQLSENKKTGPIKH